MADREQEIIITRNEASRGATALAVVIASILLLILLAYLYRGELLGTAHTSGVKINVESTN